MDLAGRNVLITGAARGIGAELARVCAARGAKVSLVGLEPDELNAVRDELGDGHVAFVADVCNQEQINDAVAATVEALGGIDIVVANAGVANFGSVAQADPDAWARCVDVNLTGMFRTAHAALPHVIERKGHIAIVCSLAALVASPGLSAYCASKSGAEAFANSLRLEVAYQGVTVSSVHPSWIDTDLVRDAEHDLKSFKRMRSRLPWPAHSTTSVEACAKQIADGIEKRRVRICVPGSVRIVHLGRVFANGPLARWHVGREAKSIMPQMEQEVEALGRSFSARSSAINDPEKVA